MKIVSTENNKGGLAARLRERADALEAAAPQEKVQAAAMNDILSFAYSAFLAARHSARCDSAFREAVQAHKDATGFEGRFDKASDEYQAMLIATDPAYRRLELARRLEKHVKSRLAEAWRKADLKINDSDFWSVTARMPLDAETFLRDYCDENRAIAESIRESEADLDGDEDVVLRRADGNARAATELLVEAGITA